MRNSGVTGCGRGPVGLSKHALSSLALLLAAALPACGGGGSGAGAASPDDASLLADDGGSQSPELEQGVAAIRAEKFEEARAHFEKVVGAEPRNAQAVFYLGVAQQNLGALSAARASFEKAVELSPQLADAWVNLTATLLDAGDAAAALPVIERGLSQHPDHPGLLYNRALALSAQRRVQEAVQAFKSALEADPSNVEIKLGYAEALILAGSRDEGLKLLAELARSDSPEVLASTGSLLGRLEQFDDCIGVFSKAIERQPAAELYVQRGLCQHGKKDDKAAFADFQKAIEVDGNYAPGHYYSGMHLRMQGKKAEAKQALARAVEIAGEQGVGRAAKRALDSL